MPVMDKNVLDAMARWPGVPDVFGWLSLSEQGRWRLHPRGDALALTPDPEPGEAIGNSTILAFMDRNYTGDAHGRWYFQNGPQRVFVRLDAAPYILRTTGPDSALRTHNGLDVKDVSAWALDDMGRMYALTEHGPGLVAGRDLPALLGALRTAQGQPLLDALEQHDRTGPIALLPRRGARGGGAAPLHFRTAHDIAATLGFVRFPETIRTATPSPAGDAAGPHV